MTRVLVAGAQGLLGSSLAPYLKTRGYQVTCHARHGGADVRVDLTDSSQALAALDKWAPEIIVNLAGLTDVDECERTPHAAYLANTRIVEIIARWMQSSRNGCHLVHVSTDQVYDGPGPHEENDVTLTNYYGFSKYAGELAAAAVPSTILRTNFFGPSRCPGRASLSDWLVDASTKRKAITVFEDVRFSPLSLTSITKLIELTIRKRTQGVFNLGSRDGMSKADFAYAIARALDLPTEHMTRGAASRVKLRAYRPKDMRMDTSRFERAFNLVLPTLQGEIQSMRAAYGLET